MGLSENGYTGIPQNNIFGGDFDDQQVDLVFFSLIVRHPYLPNAGHNLLSVEAPFHGHLLLNPAEPPLHHAHRLSVRGFANAIQYVYAVIC